MQRKAKARRNGHSGQVGAVSPALHHKIKQMAASGLVEDEICLRIGGMDKNQLRRRYIDAIKDGRVIAQEAKAAALSRKEREWIAVVERTLASPWGEIIYPGCRTVAEALAFDRRNSKDFADG